MWVSKREYDGLMARQAADASEIRELRSFNAQAVGFREALVGQKAKDDMTIDWMRHRINELTKHNAILLAKAAGIHVPVPEIVPTRPGSMTMPDFSSMPSFEDVGDDEATRLGVLHDEAGHAVYTK